LLIDDIENALDTVLASNSGKVSIFCHPFIRAYFKQGNYQWKWFMKYKRWIGLSSSNSLPLVEYSFLNSKDEKIG
jgi:hypothetical protein